jgi:hypothetical protein
MTSQPLPTSPPPAAAGQPLSAPGVSAALPPPPVTDRQAINALLAGYQAAFSQLDASAARAVWPSVDAAALARAFGQLENQNLTFSQCSVSIDGINAVAQCSGSATYVPRVGNRSPRSEYRQWDFELWKAAGRWRISAVDTR